MVQGTVAMNESGKPAQLLTVRRLRGLSYADGVRIQQACFEAVAADPAGRAFLLLVEHTPVITLGRASRREHLLAGPAELARLGIEVHESTRGGDVTYHGPGQLVGYPVMSLDRPGRDLHRFMRRIEEWVIRVCARWGIPAGRLTPHTGVWVGERKIAAIGIAARRWICYHGMALNVSTDLDRFRLIVPCGISQYGVTSMSEELGRGVDFEAVADAALEEFVREFEFDDWTREEA